MRSLFSILLIFITLTLHSQTPTCQWAQTFRGNIGEVVVSTKANQSGEVYVTGYYKSSQFIIGSDSLITNGEFDIFLAKFNSAGNLIWSKSIGGSLADAPTGMVLDKFSNIYISGQFLSPQLILSNDTLINSGNGDFLVMKCDSSGNVIWAHSGTGTNHENLLAITLDSSGNVYAAGEYLSATFHIDSVLLQNSNPGPYSDLFFLKYDNNGTLKWVRTGNGHLQESAQSIATDLSGNVCLLGSFTSSSMNLSGNIVTRSGLGTEDLFITKFDSSGNYLFEQRITGNSYKSPIKIQCDAADNIYASIVYNGVSIEFDSTFFINTDSINLTSLLFKIDSQGNLIWGHSLEGNNLRYVNSLTIDENSNIYFTGYFYADSILFNSLPLYNPNFGNANVFVFKCDSSGNGIWAISAGGANSLSEGKDLCTDSSGALYLTGDFLGQTFTIDSYSFSNTTLGTYEIFLAKLSGINSGIDNTLQFSDHFEIFPVPATNEINIRSAHQIKGTIIISDMLGKELLRGKINGMDAKLNVETLLRGIYFLSINGQSLLFVK